LIYFEGKTVELAKQDFIKAVDDYIEFNKMLEEEKE